MTTNRLEAGYGPVREMMGFGYLKSGYFAKFVYKKNGMRRVSAKTIKSLMLLFKVCSTVLVRNLGWEARSGPRDVVNSYSV